MLDGLNIERKNKGPGSCIKSTPQIEKGKKDLIHRNGKNTKKNGIYYFPLATMNLSSVLSLISSSSKAKPDNWT